MKQLKNVSPLNLFEREPEDFAPETYPTSFKHVFRLNKEFTDISQFTTLIDTLEQAGEDDVVIIRLASPGGSLDAIVPVLAAMESTEAFVHCHVDTSIASAATFIMLKGNVITFNPLADVMLHNVSYGAQGHGGNVKARVDHIDKTSRKLIQDIYSGFISDVEQERLLNGMEIYLTAEECISRLQERQDALQAQEGELSRLEEEELQALLAQIDEQPTKKPTRGTKKQE